MRQKLASSVTWSITAWYGAPEIKTKNINKLHQWTKPQGFRLGAVFVTRFRFVRSGTAGERSRGRGGWLWECYNWQEGLTCDWSSSPWRGRSRHSPELDILAPEICRGQVCHTQNWRGNWKQKSNWEVTGGPWDSEAPTDGGCFGKNIYNMSK